MQQCLQAAVRLAWRLPRFQLRLFVGQVTGQQLGVAAIILVSSTNPLAVVAQAKAIDDIDPMPSCMSQDRNFHVVDTGGFERNKDFQPGLDCAHVCGQLEYLARPRITETQLLLGNIDTETWLVMTFSGSPHFHGRF